MMAPYGHAIMQAAQSPWRVVALPWSEKTKTGQVKDSGVDEAHGVPFVDLLEPSRELYAAAARELLECLRR